ncbi:MAG: hypothetical protein OEY59_08905 [Deltaproteobacteria bacterium]|nr:hypothetical protein [Deltaproteobacteria bacterium]
MVCHDFNVNYDAGRQLLMMETGVEKAVVLLVDDEPINLDVLMVCLVRVMKS